MGASSRSFWSALCLVLVTLLLPAGAHAATEVFSTRSFTGQFIVQLAPGAQYTFTPPNLDTNRDFVRLDPTLVPVSCERMKQILWRDLGATAPYSGKVFITLYPARDAAQPIRVDAEQFSDGWQYRVLLPNMVERVRYVRAMVQVILLEMANRAATQHTAEVPLWLSEGLAQELLASSEMEIILPPPSTPANDIRFTYMRLDARRPNPLEHAHQLLTTSAPLSFDQLSWPSAEQLSHLPGDIYSSSAQLFVHQLLELRDGSACLSTMLAELPHYFNWQLAFLHAFRAHFQRPLDVEKWWRLETLHFTGRELADDTWTPDESWQKLSDAIHSSVQVRTGTNELPLRAQVSLQSIIRDWDPARQPAALEVKVRELGSLRLRLAKNCVPLLDDYRQVLTTYLGQRQHPGFTWFRRQSAARQAVQTATTQLDTLDRRLEALRPAVPSFQANALPSP